MLSCSTRRRWRPEAVKGVFVRVQPWIRASGLVGVTGLQKVLLKDWLATQ